jgi:cytochrome bd ubiquinol oxidase subunit I
MQSAVAVDRLQFAFTVTFHYIFPQLTMGLALLIVILKTLALRTGNDHYNRAARFWAKIFGINFAIGVAREFRWSSSSARTGRVFRNRRAVSSDRPWRWRAYFRFSSSPAF